MTTPLPITYKQTWSNENEFAVEFRPAVPKWFDLVEMERNGSIGSPVDEESNVYATFQDAIDKWTTEDSDIPANAEHVKYMIVIMNQNYSTDFVLGEVTELDPAAYTALETKANLSDLITTSDKVDVLEADVAALDGRVDNLENP